MSYSTDPVSDADRHIEAQDDFAGRLLAAEASVEAEIEAAFQAGSDSLLPMTRALKPFMTSKWHEALAMLDYEMPEAELLNVLSLSTCPHVVALRKEIAKQYASCFADEIARERTEGDE